MDKDRAFINRLKEEFLADHNKKIINKRGKDGLI